MSRTIRVLAVALISSFALAACTGSPTGVDEPTKSADTMPWT
jgi:predicted small secreted protein